jgi:hypothetical protein
MGGKRVKTKVTGLMKTNRKLEQLRQEMNSAITQIAGRFDTLNNIYDTFKKIIIDKGVFTEEEYDKYMEEAREEQMAKAKRQGELQQIKVDFSDLDESIKDPEYRPKANKVAGMVYEYLMEEKDVKATDIIFTKGEGDNDLVTKIVTDEYSLTSVDDITNPPEKLKFKKTVIKKAKKKKEESENKEEPQAVNEEK